MTPTALQTQVTQLLARVDRDPEAASRLLPLVYDELRAMARERLRSERAGHTLQATALVHEAFLKLVGGPGASFEGRSHFFGACANAMRQILVDHARARGAKKRGSGRARESLTHVEVSDSGDPDLILAVDEALEKLRAEDPRAAQVVELRFFGGLEMGEIAQALSMSERTVHREWQFARVRLLEMLSDD